MLAYLQIARHECDEQLIVDKLLELEEVKEAYVLFGDWDIIVKVEVENADALGEFVLKKVRVIIPELKQTSTMIVAK